MFILDFYIQGHSGCSLKIINDKLIFKSSQPNYLPRLKKQCEKQKEFYELYKHHRALIIPKVLYENFNTERLGGGDLS